MDRYEAVLRTLELDDVSHGYAVAQSFKERVMNVPGSNVDTTMVSAVIVSASKDRDISAVRIGFNDFFREELKKREKIADTEGYW